MRLWRLRGLADGAQDGAAVKPRRRRLVQWVLALVAVVALVAVAHAPLLAGAARFLMVDDALEPAVAIVALAGRRPFAETEAAELYHAGWAPRIVVVQEAVWEEIRAQRDLGLPAREGWEVGRDVLLRLGVPAAAIVVLPGEARWTGDELRLLARWLGSGAAPVIVVTSKVHTRRTSLIWQALTGGQPRGIVRGARQDPFDPEGWWHDHRFVLAVLREALGLVNFVIRAPTPLEP